MTKVRSGNKLRKTKFYNQFLRTTFLKCSKIGKDLVGCMPDELIHNFSS